MPALAAFPVLLPTDPAWLCHTLYPWPADAAESVQVDWLITHFNVWFAHHEVVLERGEHEPEYFPAQNGQPARIVFAHGYFASALHEISHWCIAGTERRKLPDLGYWYAPDGRNAEQQALFEQVEIKPQALEWLFSQACQRRFQVSLDNLNGQAGTGNGFKDHVYARVQALLSGQAVIPPDARHFLYALLCAIRPAHPLNIKEFARADL
ncbi:elongation factor P hydroxylase [Alkanindiges sp. WGS2144]|uniref:elongation factor P hydroxylase n=1 Tax=Alkanindiges sp. WGS2144 TaxID=3366808 RepID=UPI00375119F2